MESGFEPEPLFTEQAYEFCECLNIAVKSKSMNKANR